MSFERYDSLLLISIFHHANCNGDTFPYEEDGRRGRMSRNGEWTDGRVAAMCFGQRSVRP